MRDFKGLTRFGQSLTQEDTCELENSARRVHELVLQPPKQRNTRQQLILTGKKKRHKEQENVIFYSEHNYSVKISVCLILPVATI